MNSMYCDVHQNFVFTTEFSIATGQNWNRTFGINSMLVVALGIGMWCLLPKNCKQVGMTHEHVCKGE